MSHRLYLREAWSAQDMRKRDALVRRIKAIRAEAVLDLNSAEHWNRTHPTEVPLDVTFLRELIDWCDGKGPFPEEARR